jgi:hypothetical protein
MMDWLQPVHRRRETFHPRFELQCQELRKIDRDEPGFRLRPDNAPRSQRFLLRGRAFAAFARGCNILISGAGSDEGDGTATAMLALARPEIV